jgi:hypothetical protein
MAGCRFVASRRPGFGYYSASVGNGVTDTEGVVTTATLEQGLTGGRPFTRPQEQPRLPVFGYPGVESTVIYNWGV